MVVARGEAEIGFQQVAELIHFRHGVREGSPPSQLD